MTIPFAKAPPLESKRGLIGGVANDQSTAWGCAKAFLAFGANLAFFSGSEARNEAMLM
jgi:enoyl-[acyl-carrier protein] reductase I